MKKKIKKYRILFSQSFTFRIVYTQRQKKKERERPIYYQKIIMCSISIMYESTSTNSLQIYVK